VSGDVGELDGALDGFFVGELDELELGAGC
jgi:hypothetical protein